MIFRVCIAVILLVVGVAGFRNGLRRRALGSSSSLLAKFRADALVQGLPKESPEEVSAREWADLEAAANANKEEFEAALQAKLNDWKQLKEAGVCDYRLCLEDYYSIQVVSYFLLSCALQSFDLLLSYSMIVLALHITIILITTHL